MLEIDTSDYGVYIATRNDTGEVIYIGCSWTGIKDRLNKHIQHLKGNYHPNHGLQRFWNAKGLTFTHVVKCLPIEDLCLAFEKAYGAQYDFKKLMNVNPLGLKAPDTTGRKHTEETIEKISGENHWINKLTPEEYDEECKIRSERLKRPRPSMQGENHYMYDKHPSEEHCENMSKTRIEKGLSKGENNPNVKITTVIARTIKFLLFYTTLTHQEIADGIPGVTKAIVDSISAGTAWKDVELYNQRFYNV